MKKILVVDTAAEIGGALTILESFYEAVRKENYGCSWFFLVSKPKLNSANNITVLKYEWTKKSKIHRIIFDIFILPKLIKKYEIDAVLSLQNNAVITRKPQMVYVHQSIPFSNYKFHIIKEKSLWFIQNIQKMSICFGIKKANKVVVQSNWMKRACVQSTGVNEKKIIVLTPEINQAKVRPYKYANKSNNRFFYPAIPKEYKNHQVIIEACQILKKRGITNYSVEFTFKADQNKYAKKIKKIVHKNELPILFVGRLDNEQMIEKYENNVLVFPSYLETVGLPLKESCKAGGVILSADCSYAHETLKNYENAHYFQFNDAKTVANYMMKCINNSIGYSDINITKEDDSSWEVIIKEICKM